MGWRVHTASPAFVLPDVLPLEEVDTEFGGYEYDHGQTGTPVLILADEGNQEAWVLTGNSTDWRMLVARINSAIGEA